ncbi:MAG: hypothetical protein M3N91_03105, partial [Pseudomonadota bacterium]|nr:hypothetical protein [Pseudomonadota bacterium]
MLRATFLSVLAAAVCSIQSGCCCCRLPAAMIRGGGPIVINPPVVINQPPRRDNNNPFPQDQPFKDFPNQDVFKDPFKDKVPNLDKIANDKDKVANPPPAGDYVYNQRTGVLTLD